MATETSNEQSPVNDKLQKIIIDALEDIKAQDIQILDVKELSDVSDLMIIASGSSNRQVKSLAGNVVEEGKKAGFQPIGVEGQDAGEWVLVDFGDIIVHVMLPETRSFYELEKLWSKVPSGRSKDASE